MTGLHDCTLVLVLCSNFWTRSHHAQTVLTVVFFARGG